MPIVHEGMVVGVHLPVDQRLDAYRHRDILPVKADLPRKTGRERWNSLHTHRQRAQEQAGKQANDQKAVEASQLRFQFN